MKDAIAVLAAAKNTHSKSSVLGNEKKIKKEPNS